jgi:hypothetical protein
VVLWCCGDGASAGSSAGHGLGGSLATRAGLASRRAETNDCYDITERCGGGITRGGRPSVDGAEKASVLTAEAEWTGQE